MEKTIAPILTGICMFLAVSATAADKTKAAIRPGGCIIQDDKLVKPAKEWRGAFLNNEDEPLMKEAPKSGYIANEKAWAKLGKAWRGKAELPQVDFEKQLVFVGAAGGAPNHIEAEFRLSDQGDLKGGFGATQIGGPGFVYLIVVIDRAGIKTYNGKAMENE